MSEPLPESIRHLAAMMPQMVNGIRKKTIGGRGLRLVPTATCDICGKAHSHVTTGGTLPLPKLETCAECLKKLETLSLVRSKDGRYAFVKARALKPGQIVAVSVEDFDKLNQRHLSKGHENDLRRILSLHNCLDDKGNILSDNWNEFTWDALIEAGHDELEFEKCKCSKK